MPLYELAAELANAMGETWAALDMERRDWWTKLAEHVDRLVPDDDELEVM